ncbi:amidohydrolase [Salinibacillus kushneri]|uniref:Peptidase M20 domain-containing protein 2 n=1 Tax=Salinibacillus kushneri TaxID=237682 RepID=A0A1I0AFR7_9BACI|nr:M20 family metallopeptidase [Salinibacillus kushneri]SES92669.1 amidohydrolase [Salinibacillus kushneri]
MATKVTKNKLNEDIISQINQLTNHYISISHRIHANPEIGNEEKFASGLLSRTLEKNHFTVEREVAGHETAFIAKYDSGHKGPTIGFLAEYDALPGLGHACGHNIIGTASVAAAIALSQVIEQTGGGVVVLGTPAEEGGPNGSAKGSFVKHGLLEGIDACMMVHPFAKSAVTGPSLAVDPLDFEFHGKSAHAASSPEEGINALDGVIQLFNGINALRQHVTDDVRIHGIITDGGKAPNIVPDYAKARFFIRANTRQTCARVTQKVKRIAEGAALSTGTEVNVIQFQNEVDHFVLNRRFDQVYVDKIHELGETIDTENSKGLGSTDAGNISNVVPTIHPYIKIGPDTLVNHTPEFRKAANSEEGDRALIAGAKALALTGFELLTNEETLKEIKDEFHHRIEAQKS